MTSVLTPITDIWRDIKGNFEWWLLAAVLGGFLFVFFTVGWRRLSSISRLLRTFRFADQRLRWFRAWLETVKCLVENWRTPHDVYRTARLRVEHHLLSAGTDAAHDQIRLATCDDLIDDDTRKLLKEYLAQTPDRRFLTSLAIERGFVTPLHLLAGLLAQFKQNWADLIGAFGTATYLDGDHLEQWRQRQASMFLVWLIWGPSISICTCKYWSGALALQYGYGDENNSIPLLIPDAKREEWFDRLRAGALARQLGVTGRLRLAPARELFGRAQDRFHDELVLEYEASAPAAGPNYYTAYVWVIFVISQEQPSPHGGAGVSAWHPLRDRNGRSLEKWLNVLAFFEHANIADEHAYESAKEQLASKVFPTMQRIVDEVDADGRVGLRFVYGCAIDDSGCDSPKLAVPPPGKSIRDHLRTGVPDTLALRVQFDPRGNHDFSACRLPAMVKELDEHLKAGNTTPRPA